MIFLQYFFSGLLLNGAWELLLEKACKCVHAHEVLASSSFGSLARGQLITSSKKYFGICHGSGVAGLMAKKKIVPLADRETHQRLRQLAFQSPGEIAMALSKEDLHEHDIVAMRMTLCCITNASSCCCAALILTKRLPEVIAYVQKAADIGEQFATQAEVNLQASGQMQAGRVGSPL